MMKTNTLLFVLFFLSYSLQIFAQTFQKAYGGNKQDFAYDMQITSDSGYVLVGHTDTWGEGMDDIYVLKLDINGDTLWTKTIGGTGIDQASTIILGKDSSYIIAGYSGSFGVGGNDMFLTKLNYFGDTLWTKEYGGTTVDFDEITGVAGASDSGIVICGTTNTFDIGNGDISILRLNHLGDTIWVKAFGNTGNDFANDIEAIDTNGYIIVGQTTSYGAGLNDVYLLRVAEDGNLLWSKTFGGSQDDIAYDIELTSDSGFVIVGTTRSYGAGFEDVYLIKTDAKGDTLWIKTYGKTGQDFGYSVKQLPDGGYIITGEYDNTNFEYYNYLIRTNASGDTLWTRGFGNGNRCVGRKVLSTYDKGFAVAGYSFNYGGVNHSSYLLKTDSLGIVNMGCYEHHPSTVVGKTKTVIGSGINMRGGMKVSHVSPTITATATKDSIICDENSVGIYKIVYPSTNSVNVYPNPANKIIVIESTDFYSVNIYNISGQQVISVEVMNGKNTLDISSLSTGVYQIVLTNNNNVFVHKLIVTHSK